MRTLKLTIAYDGTRFVGWQRQARGESIQATLEDALARFEGGTVTAHGAGRTDAGVHALAQVASVRLASPHDCATLQRALNAQLPEEIRVLSVEERPEGFHARFDATSKSYRYQMRGGGVASPFERAYVWHLAEPLDLTAMNAAARLLIGTHDFAAFQSVGTDVEHTRRTVVVSRVVPDGHLIVYEVTADGFLRHMVRTIAGTLAEIGRGWRAPSTMADVLAGRRRSDAGATAPPRGLFLVRVNYD